MRVFLGDVESFAQPFTSAGVLRQQYEAEVVRQAYPVFGAYVMQSLGGDLLIGLSNNPGNYDGALITRSADGSTFTTERTLDEQGVHDMQVVAGRVFVPGTDPALGDDWTLGNLYERDAGGLWTKRRTQLNVLHSLGLWHDGSTLYIGAGAHTGDNATWRGRVLRSTDDGATWAAQVDVTDYRVYDVIGHAGRLYAIGYTAGASVQLHSSSDDGATWSIVAGVTPALKPRMMAFGATLLVAGESGLYQIDAAHMITARSSPFAIAQQWNPMSTDGINVYALDGIGYVWRSSDLINWSRYTYVAGAVALCWWSGVGLMVSDSGLSARIWRA